MAFGYGATKGGTHMGYSTPEPDRPTGGGVGGRSPGAHPSVLTPPVGLPNLSEAIPAQRSEPPRLPTRPPAPALPATHAGPTTCLCGHPAEMHDHLRRGSDCGACGAAGCAAYQARGGRFRWLLRRFGLARRLTVRR